MFANEVGKEIFSNLIFIWPNSYDLPVRMKKYHTSTVKKN